MVSPESIAFGSWRAGFESVPEQRHPDQPLAARQIESPFQRNLRFWAISVDCSGDSLSDDPFTSV